jgi:hypothetical protein
MTELDAGVLAAIRAGMGKVKVPHAQDRVYKDECLYSFDTCVFLLVGGGGVGFVWAVGLGGLVGWWAAV